MNYTLFCGDCLEVLPTIADQSVDAAIVDLPYGTTDNPWDSVIPLDPTWAHLRRIVRPRGALCFFASQPFASSLVVSNRRNYKYEWVWEKNLAGNFAVTPYMPLSVTESVLVFSSDGSRVNINHQMEKGDKHTRGYILNRNKKGGRGFGGVDSVQYESDLYFPRNLLRFNTVPRAQSQHPSEKPTDLLAYLVRTYTDVGGTVLDFTMGSGSTGVSCVMEGRNFIGIELDPHYYAIAERRIANAQPPLFVADVPAVPEPEQVSFFA